MDIDAYLERIGYRGTVHPTHEVLCALQRHHLLSVPFENLDIHEKIPIDFRKSYEKVVVRRRGGFCYELNFLFFQLLQSLDFKCHIISARVWDRDHGFGAEYDHMAVVVDIGGKSFLSDVGFGEFSFQPLPLIFDQDHQDDRGLFRLEQYDEIYHVVKHVENEVWQPDYLFTLQPRKPEEFLTMCNYHQTSPDSPFARKILCNLLTPTGRITLAGNSLKVVDGDEITVEEVELSQRAEVLKKWFNFQGFNRSNH